MMGENNEYEDIAHFSPKRTDIFLAVFLHKNIHCEYSLEVPQ